jgi:hypothetical protein
MDCVIGLSRTPLRLHWLRTLTSIPSHVARWSVARTEPSTAAAENGSNRSAHRRRPPRPGRCPRPRPGATQLPDQRLPGAPRQLRSEARSGASDPME